MRALVLGCVYIFVYRYVFACMYMYIYRKRGKIHWAKLSLIPPIVVFHGKTFAVPYVYNTKTMPLYEACIIK